MSCFWDGQNIRYASTFCSASGTSYDINDLLNNEPVPVTEPFGETDFAATADGASPGLSSSDSVGNVTGLIDLNNGALVTFKGCDKSIAVPEGWEDGAPADDTWVLGYYWQATDVLPGEPTVYATRAQVIAALSAYTDSRIPGLDASRPSYAPHYTYVGTYTNASTAVSAKNMDKFGNTLGAFAGYRYACTPSGVGGLCPTEAPTLTEWPSDGTYEIIMSGGKFYASNDDPDAPQTLKDGTTTLNFTGGITWTANSDGTYTITDGVNTQTIRCDGSRAS